MLESSIHIWLHCWLGAVFALCAAGSCASYAGPAEAPTADSAPPADAPAGKDCRPYDVIPTLQSSTKHPTSLDVTCTVEPSGTLTMQFMPLACPDITQGWWAGCAFAANQDLSDFDAQGRGEGVIAVKVCVKDMVPSALNLRYGSPSLASTGRSKYMNLISGYEVFGTGCRLVYLSPSDACYSSDHCGVRSGCAPPDDTCDTFARSQLIIVNEFCAMLADPPAKPTVVTVERVTYYPASCLCDDTQSCASPSVCRRDGWPAGAKCDPNAADGCPGVCAP